MSGALHDYSSFTKTGEDGLCHIDFAVDGITCAGCMTRIERELKAVPGVKKARVNFTQHRLAVDWEDGRTAPETLVRKLARIGYTAFPFDPDQLDERQSARSKQLLHALAVAGFSAMNIMLLSISIWSGNVTGMDPATRDLMHWISALIAIPTVAYSGRPFFASAWTGLRAGNVNMDFPISLAVVLATAMSLVQLYNGARDAYFDSAVMLLFFLLVGRYLDENMRRRTRALAHNLVALQGQAVSRPGPDGSLMQVPLSSVRPGDEVFVAAGERIGVDGVVLSGNSAVDLSLVTGETRPQPVETGGRVIAGTLNLTGNLRVRTEAVMEGTVLAEIGKLLEKAGQTRARYVRLADRAARAYVPLVHSAAAIALVGWLIAGAGWQDALLTAISVLIITCPCALALAVPVVQVVTSGVLFRSGILLNTGDALERMAEVTHIVFDKTGTLTLPEPRLVNSADIDPEILRPAGRLAAASSHPLAVAVARAAGMPAPVENAREMPGEGIMAQADGMLLKLGSAAFCGAAGIDEPSDDQASTIWFRAGEAKPVVFRIAQLLRPDAARTVRQLKAMGLGVEIISGDNDTAVRRAALELGIDDWQAGLTPARKIEHLEALEKSGLKVAMIGDGLNDAPALRAAHASMSPVSAADISRAAADFVFMGEGLFAVATTVRISRLSRRLMLQNLTFAALYNSIAVPLAVFGFVNPLIAALAMSGSSMMVTLNALRGRLAGRTVSS